VTGHRSGPSDTSEAVEALLVEAHRRMTPQQKIRRVLDCNAASEALAAAGLRARHGTLGDAELRLRVAALRLDRETMRRAFGWEDSWEDPGPRDG
jgi:hypothetical protein